MADQQLALKLAEGGGIGLARMMVEQMQSKGYVGDEAKTQEAANLSRRLKPIFKVFDYVPLMLTRMGAKTDGQHL